MNYNNKATTTNPFDNDYDNGDLDDYSNGLRSLNGGGPETAMASSTNPFDDDLPNQSNITNNVNNNRNNELYSNNMHLKGGYGTNHKNNSSNVGMEDGIRMVKEEEDNNDFVDIKNGFMRVEGETKNELDEDIPVEDSWQFLGDLPYRRVPLYTDVQWGRNNDEEEGGSEDFNSNSIGLASFSPQYLEQRGVQYDYNISSASMYEMLSATNVTKVTGCPMGGPVATVTIPVGGSSIDSSSSINNNSPSATADIRIMTNSGQLLSKIPFPPISLRSSTSRQNRQYTASDIQTIGFTNRTNLIVVLRDSLCLTFDLGGNEILPPFYILPQESGGLVEVLESSIFEGGVAILSTTMTTALVELLDNYDDPSYVDSAHVTARKIFAINATTTTSGRGEVGIMGGIQASTLPQNFALVTMLPTAAHASANCYTYCTLAVLPRIHTNNRHPEIFLSTSDNSVVVANVATGDITDVDCRARISAPIVSMSFAPNGRFLACFTQSLLLTVISTSFETKVLDFDTSKETSSPPRDMKWCGEDSVVLHWKKIGVLMVGPYGDWLRFPYENSENLYIVPEIDCCRIVTDDCVEILQRVPPATAQMLRIGSIEPSAMLLDASDAFESGSPGSDEAARAITRTGMLIDAIETCVDAAMKEFDIHMQKRLLKAASYGMHFAYKDHSDRKIMGGSTTRINNDNGTDVESLDVKPSSTALKFVSIAQKIRVTNALRDQGVGFALTSSQFDSISPTGVISRLLAMHRPDIATAICSYLDLDKSVKAYARASRAVAFVSSKHDQTTDSRIAELAVNIMNEDANSFEIDSDTDPANLNRGAFAMVALAAHKSGKLSVAHLILKHEKSIRDKVLALISIGSYAEAATVATNARDANLAFSAVLEFEKHIMGGNDDPSKLRTNFFVTLDSKFQNESYNLYRSYLASMPDLKQVLTLLRRGQNYSLTGTIVAQKALGASKEERKKLLQEASRIFNLGRDAGFQKSCTDEYLDLLSEQERLRSTYNSNDIAPENSSVSSTLFRIICFAASKPREAHRILNEAEKLARKFRVPDKRFWHLRVRAFASSGQWANLKSLADSRTKPPISLKHFALAAIKGKQGVGEIMRYIEKVTDPEERYDLFCEAKLWKKAIDEATKLGDAMRIMHVRSLSNSPEIQSLCDKWAAKIGT